MSFSHDAIAKKMKDHGAGTLPPSSPSFAPSCTRTAGRPALKLLPQAMLAAGLLSVLVLPLPADAQQAESRQAESSQSEGSPSATANAADTAAAQDNAVSLAPVRVTADFDPDDVRPEGVTTATKTYLAPKDIPQAIDTVEVSKSKSYGINDLSIMLDGVPGVSTAYDMRGEGLTIRGFEADRCDCGNPYF